jgi:hypothetical protein
MSNSNPAYSRRQEPTTGAASEAAFAALNAALAELFDPRNRRLGRDATLVLAFLSFQAGRRLTRDELREIFTTPDPEETDYDEPPARCASCGVALYLGEEENFAPWEDCYCGGCAPSTDDVEEE